MRADVPPETRQFITGIRSCAASFPDAVAQIRCGSGDPVTHVVGDDALNMAIQQRKPQNVIHHSDQGPQYTSLAFGQRCAKLGVRPSMGSVGDAYDNAMAESFFASLECELIDRRSFQSKAEARLALFTYIEGWYNPRRRHSGLGHVSPINFERSQQNPLPSTLHHPISTTQPA